ncbi:ABC transporter permease [bacterium]|nr:ABC transporter permease [bacterium]
MKKNQLGLKVAYFWIAAWFLVGCFIPESLEQHRLINTLQGPTWLHPFGFDAFGRDLLLVGLKASVTSLIFAAVASVLSCVVGTFLGCFIALSPYRIQFFGSRILDLLLAFPGLLLALAWAAIRGPSWETLVVSLILGTLPGFTRLIFVTTKEISTEGFVTAAQSLGATRAHVIIKHLTPSLFSIWTIKIPTLFAHALIAEASLSFLGIGAPVGSETWGSLLSQGQAYLLEAPHLAFGAGFPLVLMVLALQWIAESRGKNPKSV